MTSVTASPNDRRLRTEPLRYDQIVQKVKAEREMPDPLPAWAVNMQLRLRQEYESKLAAAERRIAELEHAIMESKKADRIANNTRALAAYGSGDDVKGLTNRLTYMLPNANEIGTPGVALVAQIAIAHGLDPLPGADHLYAWKQRNKRTGKDEVQVVIGYKGLLHLARKQTRFTYQSRPMTAEERAEHGIADQPAAVGYVTTLYILTDAIECQRAGIPYYPLVGTAVWRPGDEVPRGRTPAWVAKKNSLKDALRQVVTTGTRLQEAIDNALQQIGQLSGVEYTGEGWRVEVSDDGAQALIEAGLVPPDDEGDDPGGSPSVGEVSPESAPAEPPATGQPVHADPAAPALCRNCQIEPADPTNPVDPALCPTCARNIADAQAAAGEPVPPTQKAEAEKPAPPTASKPPRKPTPQRSAPNLRQVGNAISQALQVMADDGVEIVPAEGWDNRR
jgi:hypothetical protein